MEVKTYILRPQNGLIDPCLLTKMRDGRFDGKVSSRSNLLEKHTKLMVICRKNLKGEAAMRNVGAAKESE